MQETAPIRSQTEEMKIGNTTFIVSTHFKENGRETGEQKLQRYVLECIQDGVRNSKR